MFLIKSILLSLILSMFSNRGFTSDSSHFKIQHGISFELGAYHRGMVGLGYHCLLPSKNSNSFYGITASIGSKQPWVNPENDLFLTLAFSRNRVYESRNLVYGIELKYIMTPYWDEIGWSEPYRDFQDFTYGVFFGFEAKLTENFSLQPRLSYARSLNPLTSAAPWYSVEQNYYSAFGIGASIIYYFK
jgi:hypothetical protein